MTTHYDGLPRNQWMSVERLNQLKEAGRDVSDVGSVSFHFVNGKMVPKATLVRLKRRQGKPVGEPE